MSSKIFSFLLIVFYFSMLGKVYAEQSVKNQSVKLTPLENKILKARTRLDFKGILCEVGLINPLDTIHNKTIDAAMKIPLSNRLLVFYCVLKSIHERDYDDDNDIYFEIFSDLSSEDIIDLFESTSLLFSKIKSKHDCQQVYRILKDVKKERRYKLAQYIKSIASSEMKGNLSYFADKIAYINEDDLPDVMGRVMTIAKEISDHGITDLISNISHIPKDKRDFILIEAKKLTTSNMETIEKAHLIGGLADLKSEDFSDIVNLGKQLFFEDTHGGHRSLILKTIQRIEKEKRPTFVSQVKPLLNFNESPRLRMNIINILANFEENDRAVFIGYLPPTMSIGTKNKIFDNLDYLKGEDIKKVLSYLKERLPEKTNNEEKLLTTILSSIHMLKLNKQDPI